MAEEGLKKTKNDLIHIGCPIPFDVEEFLQELDGLLEAAYSQNKKKKKEKKDYKWTDFLTSIPDFLQNRYIQYDTKTQNIVKERPWLTFGITVYDQRSSKMLYIQYNPDAVMVINQKASRMGRDAS